MHNPFRTKGAAAYAEGCGPSDSTTHTSSSSKTPAGALAEIDACNKKDVDLSYLEKNTSTTSLDTTQKKGASTTVTEVQGSLAEEPVGEPMLSPETLAKYPSNWPRETIMSIEKAKIMKARNEGGEEGRGGASVVKGVARKTATVESVAVGVAVAIAHLLG